MVVKNKKTLPLKKGKANTKKLAESPKAKKGVKSSKNIKNKKVTKLVEKQDALKGISGKSTISVMRTQYSDRILNQSSKEQLVEVSAFETAPATVSFGAGVTKNVGNYESLRVDVQLTLPCYVEEVEDAFKAARDWVDSTMDKELAELVTEQEAV